jgi:hypothetical protein
VLNTALTVAITCRQEICATIFGGARNVAAIQLHLIDANIEGIGINPFPNPHNRKGEVIYGNQKTHSTGYSAGRDGGFGLRESP